MAELRRSTKGLLLSGFSAGLDIGFSLFFMGVMLTLFGPEGGGVARHLAVANMYSVGFIFVILGRSELFTEHTTLAVFPVLGRVASLRQMARLWLLVYSSNLAGTVISALLSVTLGPRLGIIEPWAFIAIAEEMVSHDASTILLSALAAGWLMGLVSWLVRAAQDTVGRILVVWLITSLMGTAGLHHCIVGSVEVLAGVFTSPLITLGEYGYFLFWTTLGNAVGGVTMVALVKFSHATHVPEVEDSRHLEDMI